MTPARLMEPTTLARPTVVSDPPIFDPKFRGGGAESVQAAATTQAPPAKPTWDEVCDLMREAGFKNKQIAKLMRMFKRAADAVDYDAGTSTYIRVDMSVHNQLDRIMPDKGRSTPGTIHDALERHFLRPGWGLEHDRHGFCSVQAVPV